jgi:hypothetical protein
MRKQFFLARPDFDPIFWILFDCEFGALKGYISLVINQYESITEEDLFMLNILSNQSEIPSNVADFPVPPAVINGQ